MKKLLCVALLLTLDIGDVTADDPYMRTSTPATVSVCFTPYERCSNKIVAAIDGATISVLVQAYQFTAMPIIKALVRAKKRGVDVKAILDFKRARREKNSGLPSLYKANIPVWIDHPKRTAHSKLIIVDETLVIGGSYNYTSRAENKNTENVTFIDGAKVAGWYVENWRKRQKISRLSSGERP